MARYVCRCGSILSDSVTPEISYRVYSDHEWLDIVNDKTVTEGIMGLQEVRTRISVE